jgi:protein-disulfide isomerase
MLLVAGGALAVAAVAIVLSVVLGGSDKSSTPPTITADLSAVSGIPQNGLVLGKSVARVAMTEFADTSCPVCRDYALNTFPTLSNDYVRTGKVRMELRLVDFVGASSPRGRALVLAAARQNKAWQLLELLYQNQGDETQDWLTDDLARAIAAKVPGLDVDKLFADADSTAIADQGTSMDAEAQTAAVRGTPTFFLTTPDGKVHLLAEGNGTPSQFAEKLDQALSS